MLRHQERKGTEKSEKRLKARIIGCRTLGHTYVTKEILQSWVHRPEPKLALLLSQF